MLQGQESLVLEAASSLFSMLVLHTVLIKPPYHTETEVACCSEVITMQGQKLLGALKLVQGKISFNTVGNQ